MERENTDWGALAGKVFCISVAALAIWLTLRYARALIAVLLISCVVSTLINPISEKISARLGIPRKVCSLVLVILLLLLLGVLLTYAMVRITREVEEGISWLSENRDLVSEKLDGLFYTIDGISSRIPFLDGDGGASTSIKEFIRNFIKDALEGIGTGIGDLLGRALSATPAVIIFVVVTVMSTIYLSVDYVKIRDGIVSALPDRARSLLHSLGERSAFAARRYVRAYVLLFLITFAEVFVGLLILGRRYAFLAALAVATVDFLPIFGAGTVLVPWAIISLILKNYYLGFGLLILYGVVTIVRQIAEPHILGESLGIHPLMSLLFMFAGFQLFGFLGMILGPVAALAVKEFFLTRRLHRNI